MPRVGITGQIKLGINFPATTDSPINSRLQIKAAATTDSPLNSKVEVKAAATTDSLLNSTTANEGRRNNNY